MAELPKRAVTGPDANEGMILGELTLGPVAALRSKLRREFIKGHVAAASMQPPRLTLPIGDEEVADHRRRLRHRAAITTATPTSSSHPIRKPPGADGAPPATTTPGSAMS